MTVRTSKLDVSGGKMAVHEWGDPAASDVVVCAHGLTRNGRDFDYLAEALVASGKRRVVAFDTIGRGESDRLTDPTGYSYPTYIGHALALLEQIGAASVDWVGTSMGGILGMAVVTQAPKSIRRLVLNDVGGFIPKEALLRLINRPPAPVPFADLEAAEAHFRRSMPTFGPVPEDGWAHIARHGVRQREDGKYDLHYDPAILKVFAGSEVADVSLWPAWAAVTQPVLLVRGAESDLLLRPTALGMVARGGVELVEVAHSGHAPMLMTPDQIGAVKDWLDRPFP